VGDELGIPQRDAIDDGAAPVVAAEDDFGCAELGCEFGCGCGDGFVAVKGKVCWVRGCATEAGEVGADYSEAEVEQDWDLVTPGY